jgi:GDPmannose 4,6-dehydratase
MISQEKRALVLGSNGQDGSYLVEHLLRRGYSVSGLARSKSVLVPHARFTPVQFDLRHAAQLPDLLLKLRPQLIFHVAAVHGRAGTPYETVWQDMLAVNVGSVHPVLEYLRQHCPGGGLIYAGSSKSFGPVFPPVITEQSPISSSCLYTVTKNAARDLIACYRRDHGVTASVLHLFQHESERRGPEFFIPKLLWTLGKAIEDRSEKTEFGPLDFYCDWGSASEYMDIAIDLAERGAGDDVLVATGTTWLARDLAEKVFAKHGLNYRDHVVETGSGDGADRSFKVSVEGLRKLAGRVPQIKLLDLCETILHGLPKHEGVQ